MTYISLKHDLKSQGAGKTMTPKTPPKRVVASFCSGVASVGLQPKLIIGAHSDPLEREADNIANQIIGMDGYRDEVFMNPVPDSTIRRSCSACDSEERQNFSITRRTTHGGSDPMVARKCDRCEAEDVLRRSAESQASDPLTPDSSFVARLAVERRRGGTPLSAATRLFMEPRFGADFSNVRLHHGSEAAELAGSIDARAFTLGNDVFFARRSYDPASLTGKHLLAHELVHTLQQDGNRLRRAPINRIEQRRTLEERAIHEHSRYYWQCQVPENNVVHDARPGAHYQTKGTDTLRSIAEQVHGPGNSGPAEDAELLTTARLINDHPCNVKFHARSRSKADKLEFLGTQIVIKASFADTVEAQAASFDGGHGDRYPVIRIPPLYYKGDTPTDDDWNRNDRSGMVAPGTTAGGSSLVGDSCKQYVDIRDPSQQCDLTEKIEAIWASAEHMVSTAYAAFPRPDAGGKLSGDFEALMHSFALSKNDLTNPRFFPILQEIRANFSSIDALMKRRPIRIECDSGGNEWGDCETASGQKAGASANRAGRIVLCAATLLGSEKMVGGARKRFIPTTWDDIALVLIHEVAHYTLVGGGDVHYFPGSWSGLEPIIATNTPDSYAQFADRVGTKLTPTFGPPKCST